MIFFVRLAKYLDTVRRFSEIDTASIPAADVERRSAYERRHVAGARFSVPDRLQEFVVDVPASQRIVLARIVAAELGARIGREVHALAGGTQAWAAARLPTDGGPEGVLTGDDDHWYSPYAHADLGKRDAGFKQYLDWETRMRR